MATYSATTKLIFGMADVTIGATPAPLLADRVVFRAEPAYQDITVYDFGQGPVDRIVVGWNISLDLAFAEESKDIWEMVLPLTEVGTTSTHLEDSKIGTSLRAMGKEITIHPRNAADQNTDIVIFKAVPNGGLERAFGLEQGQLAVSFVGLVKDNADSTQSGNYFCFGPKTTA